MTRAAWLALIVIILCGTWLRVNDLALIPPGLYHDEAFSGLDALSIVRGAGLPIFFEGNGGREPFFIYLHALSILLFGTNPFALRVAAAFVGIATLPAFFVLLRALNATRQDSTGIALIGTAALATFYWHLNFSRVGWRTISLPFFACLAFYFFWRARRTGKLLDHLLTGALLGACLYTYLADRFLPFVLAAFWLIEFVAARVGRSREFAWRTWLRNAAAVVIAALVVFLPLAMYYASHLNALFFRVTDVTLAAQGNPAQAILANAQRVAGIFYGSGDVEWRHGIAGRSILDWVTGAAFASGVLAALWRWKKPETWFGFLWLSIMLLPTVLSKDAPDTQRAIGALPAVCLFVAWGGAQLADFAASLTRSSRRGWMFAAALVVLVGSGWITYRDYFLVWANDRHAYSDFQGAWADLAHWVDAQNQNVILPLELYTEPTIQFLTLQHFPTVRSVAELSDAERNQIAGEPSQVLLSQNQGDAFVLLRDGAATFLNPSAAGAAALRALPDQKPWLDKWNRPVVNTAFANLIGAGILNAPTMTTINADLGHRLNLLGYALPDRTIQAGKPYTVTLFWSSRAPIQQATQVFAHLLDTNGAVVAGVDEAIASGYPLGLWRAGQLLPDQHRLNVDASSPPGKYSIEVGVYLPATGERLPVWIDNARAADDRVLIGPLKIPQRNTPAPALTRPIDVRFGDAIALTGFDSPAGTIKPGEPAQVTLLWKSIHPISRDYTVFVHVLDARGNIVAQADHQPQKGAYPTSIWDTGEQVRDDFAVVLPPQTPAGKFTIAIGLYDLATGQRLPARTTDGASSADQIILDSPLEVSAN